MTQSTRVRVSKKDLGRVPAVEADLSDKYHVGFAFLTNVPTTSFDIEGSLANQARFEAINEDTVEQYVEAVNRGDHFPAVIAYRKRKGGKLVIVDGNHRLVAHDRAGASMDVYEIEDGTRAQVIALMTFAFNTKHGRPTSEAERVTQAIYLIDNGASLPQASAAVNVPERIVKRAVNKANADKRADEVGLVRREWDNMGAAVRARLLNITTDEGFKDASELAFKAKMGADEVFELVSLLNGSKSATRQRALVRTKASELSDRIQDLAGGVLGTAERRAIGPKQRVAMCLGQVTALPDDVAAIARTYAEAEREEAASSLLDASEKLRKIALAINPKAK